MEDNSRGKVGAFPLADGTTRFLVWAPKAEEVRIQITGVSQDTYTMQALANGYFSYVTDKGKGGSLYSFVLDGRDKFLPDPASRFQPQGVHGPSAVVDPQFTWTDHAWPGLKLDELVIYELHAGCFSREGNFAGIIPYLQELKQLGITAIEIMPVAQFPGKRNWGYDGVFPFAVQNSYGGPEGLKKLIDICHGMGLGVILDVVYNHLGPEGNYLNEFGYYFQDRYKTPWGGALNFDGAHSDHVRHYFIQNALQWLDEYHIDALRLDAVHAIFDTSAISFLEELGMAKRQLEKVKGRPYYLIAESDANDSRLLTPSEWGGAQLDGQWVDDFHHSIHALLTEERLGYYQDFGEPQQMAKVLAKGVIYQGEYSRFRDCKHGRPYHDISQEKIVVYSQNHDQVGNRPLGERLSQLLPFAKLKLSAAFVFLSPYTPLLFMGEEYGEEKPFLYFIDHSDPELIEAVRKGRAKEFRESHADMAPPDPAGEETFLNSQLQHEVKDSQEKARNLLQYYKRLIAISQWIRTTKIFANDNYQCMLDEGKKTIWSKGQNATKELYCFFSLNDEPQALPVIEEKKGRILLRSSVFQEDGDLQEPDSKTKVHMNVLKLLPFEALAFLVET